MRLAIVSAITVAALLTGCSDPKNAKLPADLGQMGKIQSEVKKLKPEEQKLLMGYVARRTFAAAFNGGASQEPADLTIGQAIDAQQKFVTKQEQEAAARKEAEEKAKAEKELAVTAMRNAVSIRLVGKEIVVERGYGGMEIDKKIKISFEFQNNSGKDIAGVKGLIVVYDLFGDPVTKYSMSTDQSIKAGGAYTWVGGRSTKFSFSDNKDEKFVSMTPDKFKIEWVPAAIVFEDGTNLKMPST